MYAKRAAVALIALVALGVLNDAATFDEGGEGKPDVSGMKHKSAGSDDEDRNEQFETLFYYDDNEGGEGKPDVSGMKHKSAGSDDEDRNEQFETLFYYHDNSKNVVVIIVSQSEAYHASMAAWLKADIERQVHDLEQQQPTVYISSEKWRLDGAWRIVPLLRPLLAQHGDGEVTWLLFLEPHTALRYASLVQTLAAFGPEPGSVWIGYPLTDVEPTIIHHFSLFDEFSKDEAFTYPNFASGFAITMHLVKKLVKQIDSGKRETEGDFSIDPAFELAQLIYGDKSNPGPLLSGELSFCVVSGDECTTYPKPYSVCSEPIAEDSIYFAVKTWSGFHRTRAQLVRETWGAHVTHLQFFSDKNDPSIHALDIGVPNTKTGHCAKTVAILKYITSKLSTMPKIKWIFLADDDTILGVKRLCEYLSCLRGGDTLTIVGERYGYGYGNKETTEKGYDYITGGGGIVLSTSAAEFLSRCACAAADAPDDMTLGACAKFRFNLTVTHSPLFHQARPQDYSQEYLSRDRPVSFHKHWMVEPRKLYRDWFETDDLTLHRDGRTHDAGEL